MIREITIKNYKSILDHTIELGRINVFIGENGCGKTNILEAVAMGGAALTGKLEVEELFARGIRVAKASIMRSSFTGARSKEITLGYTFDAEHANKPQRVVLHLSAQEGSPADPVKWFEERGVRGPELQVEGTPEAVEKLSLHSQALEKLGFGRRRTNDTNLHARLEELARSVAALGPEFSSTMPEFLLEFADRNDLSVHIGEFGIYNANALALRGMQTMSRRTPLGIYGENLDVTISALKAEVWADLLSRAKCVSWLDNIVVDPADKLKYEGHKLGQSKSTLYFHDRFMRRKNNVFSAENVNEGILHVLFYLTLFVSAGTPKVLGIDNIEAALNPQLCRDLMKQLAELAKKHDKQALITTHNPAILDGLNLHDDDQRLFVVSRNDAGHTETERIKLKPGTKEGKYKLSELWMRGALGGLPPQRF